MKVISTMHYLIREVVGGRWRYICYPCLAAVSRGDFVRVVSYSFMPCEACGAKYKAPPGQRLSFKTRTVTYQIVATYPEWDQTA